MTDLRRATRPFDDVAFDQAMARVKATLEDPTPDDPVDLPDYVDLPTSPDDHLAVGLSKRPG